MNETPMPITLKSLYQYLRLIENPSELKRRLPASSNPRTLKEGLCETSRLVEVDEAVFKDAQTIAALIGAQRFVMIWGEPSVTEQVARVFDGSRLLLAILIGTAPPSQRGTTAGTAPQQGGAMAALSSGHSPPTGELPAAWAQSNVQQESALDSLHPLLSGNVPLTCRVFRALFEHMLGCAPRGSASQGSVSLVNDLTGSKEHGRSFLSTALFILGAELDHDNLMSFMMQQGLFGIPLFEHMVQNRDYCEAFHSFRRLERAFMGSPTAEEAHLRNRLDKFNAQFGGQPYGAKIFDLEEQDKAKLDAYLAAADLLEAMALTPWCISLNKAVSIASSNSIRSLSVIAGHFERFSRGERAREQTNCEIADHLLAFARQFSVDTKPA
ncbi:MAG TPA: hypothetical protein VJA21_08605 [Verrucomicrobiae bacterium]